MKTKLTAIFIPGYGRRKVLVAPRQEDRRKSDVTVDQDRRRTDRRE